MKKLFSLQIDNDIETEILPTKILEEQCIYLNEDTKGIVIGRVAKYSLDSAEIGYWNEAIVNPSNFIIQNIQSSLGEICNNTFTYEFFLTSKKTPDYKFRVMFMKYNISYYPVTVILEREIAGEIHNLINKEYALPNNIYTYFIPSVKDFEEVLSKIFNSKRFNQIVSKLIQINND